MKWSNIGSRTLNNVEVAEMTTINQRVDRSPPYCTDKRSFIIILHHLCDVNEHEAYKLTQVYNIENKTKFGHLLSTNSIVFIY